MPNFICICENMQVHWRLNVYMEKTAQDENIIYS